MSIFREALNKVLNEKEYKKLRKNIQELIKNGIIKKEDEDKLYSLVVDEYEDAEEDPDSATIEDIIEIADASGIELSDDDDDDS